MMFEMERERDELSQAFVMQRSPMMVLKIPLLIPFSFSSLGITFSILFYTVRVVGKDMISV